MTLLLDTCAFIWLMTEPDRVPAAVRDVFQDTDNPTYLSVASAWEIATKSKLGQLRLPDQPERYVPDRISAYGLGILDIRLPHAIRAGALPIHHKDPFDRMLIAQAACEKMTIATPDPAFAPYDVRTLW